MFGTHATFQWNRESRGVCIGAQHRADCLFRRFYLFGSGFRSFTIRDGGADRDRTGDLLLAKQALSQLSYSPQALTIV
jgi:hypothetical protein